MTDIAIIASAIKARENLLERAVQTWRDDALGSSLDVAIRIYSQEFDAHEMCAKHLSGYVDWAVQTGPRSGSHIAGYNYWWQHQPAKVYLFTHPDILFSWGTLRNCMTHATPNVFYSHRILWLPQYVTERLGDFPWRFPERLVDFPEMCRLDERQHGEFYWNTNLKNAIPYESTTTYALDAATAARVFPFPDLGHQGYDDPLHFALRQHLGIKTVTADIILAHQWHPQTWGGDCDEAVREAQQLLAEYKRTRGNG